MKKLQFLQDFMTYKSISVQELAKRTSVPANRIDNYLMKDDARLSEMIDIFKGVRYVLVISFTFASKEYMSQFKRLDALELLFDEQGWDKSGIAKYLEADDILISQLCSLCYLHNIKLNFGVKEGLYEDRMNRLYKHALETALIYCKFVGIDAEKIETTLETDNDFKDFSFAFFNAVDMSHNSDFSEELNKIKPLATYDPSV